MHPIVRTNSRKGHTCAGTPSQVTASMVTTIIPVWNRAELLIEAVDSVLSQTYRPIEIIIIDDGSTDETSVVAKNLAATYRNAITYLRHERSGPGASRELGRRAARGEYIQYLDSDDLLLPNKFECQVAGLKTHPGCAVSYGKTRYYRIGETPTNVAHKRTGERIEKMFPGFLQARCWSTSTPLFTRRICDRAGPWLTLNNEEDWEYDCRVASLDVRLHYCDEFVSDTRDHDDHRLCKDLTTSANVLKDRACAHQRIYQHAIHAGVGKETPEMQHFARELFFLSRQCASVGLTDEAKSLFNLAREASVEERLAELKIYKMLADLVGWTRMGIVSEKFDHLRSRVSR